MSKRKQEKNKKIEIITVLKWLPVYATLVLLPLVTYYHIYYSRLMGYPFYTDAISNFDFDLYSKYLVFLYITVAVVLLLAFLLYQNRKELFTKRENRKQWYLLIPAGVFLLLSFLSSVCSETRYAAFMGCDDQFESFFVWAGYILLAVYLFFLLQNEKDMKHAGIVAGIGMIELSLLGIIQYAGFTLTQYNWYQKLIAPKKYFELGGTIGNTSSAHTVTLNAHNTNYAGVLLALLAALCLGVLLTEKKIGRMIGELVLLLALVTCQIGTGSRAGLLVLAVTAVLAIMFLAKKLVRYWYVLIPAITFVVLSVSLFVQYLNLPIVERLESALTIEKAEENPIQRMVTTHNGVEITYKDVYFKVSMTATEEEISLYVSDEVGNSIPLTAMEDGISYYLEQETLSDVIIKPGLLNENIYLLIINIDGRDWMFLPAVQGRNQYLYLNRYYNLDTMEETNRIGFEGYERFASGRGFIWSQSLALLFDRILIGEGANCFVFAYPHHNYKDEVYYMGGNQVTTRPHNLYLQIGVENGLVALVALVVFWAWYLLQSVRIYFKSRFKTWTERIGFGCFLAVFVYLVCGLSNDSMITVSPTFWCILGIGLAANRLVKKAQEEEKTRVEAAKAE